jgi:transketolase
MLRFADAIRRFALDATTDPGAAEAALALAMADAAAVLWTRFHKFDAADPAWPDRDRFVVSTGHGALLLHALLHLTGHDGVDCEEAEHLEFGTHPGIEASSGPLGQGLAIAVGMALAERLMAARFGRSLVDHRTWVMACDGDLMEGVTHEAASLAGQLRLGKLAVLWYDCSSSIDHQSGADQLKRFAAYGWAVKRVDSDDAAQIAAALSMAMRSKKPTLIACRSAVAGAAAPVLGPISHALTGAWQRAGTRGSSARRAWLKRLAHHPLQPEFERGVSGRLPDACYDALALLKSELGDGRPTLAPVAASRRVHEMLLPAVPELIGGGADLADGEPPELTVGPGSFGGRRVRYGVREHAMSAAMNGMALHGGLIPCGEIGVAATDYMRPALRLAAIMRQRVIHLLADDPAVDRNPAQQALEQLAVLRAMPNAHVFRPADAIETVECWELALRRADGPSLIALGGRDAPPLRTDAAENRCARGGYVIADANGPRQATILASGAEVHLALAARYALAADGIAVAVVSLPCWELFAQQDETYRAHVLGGGVRVGVEAASGFGWERWLGCDGVFIGIAGFGAPDPTAAAIADAVRKRHAEPADQERTRGNGR